MAVEKTESGAVVVTGEHIQVVRILAVTKALSLEVKTGLKMPQRPANAAKAILAQHGIKPSGRKAKLLEQMTALCDSYRAIFTPNT